MFQSYVAFFTRPAQIVRGFHKANLRPDLIAGLTVAVILLPQAVAYATLAGVSPQMGLYTAVIAAIFGALWGSSNQLHTGPASTTSLLVFAALLAIAQPGSPRYLAAAGLLAVMVGLFRLALGLARLGMLVNFVSDSVIIGFTAGAAGLIWVSQLSALLGLNIPASSSLIVTLTEVIRHLDEASLASLAMGVSVVVLILLLRRLNPKIPGPLIAIILADASVGIFGLTRQGIKVLGQVSAGLPPLMRLPLFDIELISQLAGPALAIGAIGLVEALSAARSMASQTGQRLDSNQEFVGQGISNIVSGLFSGYEGHGAFSRSALNIASGAQTPIASVFSGLFVLVGALLLGPLATNVPKAALAGVLLVIGYGMIDRKEIVRIWRGAPGDVLIMLITLGGALLLPLQFAVLAGILVSFAVYIIRTSVPRVVPLLPDANYHHLVRRPGLPLCPQLALFDILGDLYFGAVSNVERTVDAQLEQNPGQRFVLLRMQSVNQCDISGIHVLESILHHLRDRGGDLFLFRVQEPVRQIMQATGFYRQLGADRFLPDDGAITVLYHRVLDPAVCIYECEVRVFLECQNLPKQLMGQAERIPLRTQIPAGQVAEITPPALWKLLCGPTPPLVIDVREPREFSQGHIPQAQLIPLRQLLSTQTDLPRDRTLVFVCQGGQRGTRAAYALGCAGYTRVMTLQGGMLAWEAAGLLEAVS
jgi:sulfate permease, SulP family